MVTSVFGYLRYGYPVFGHSAADQVGICGMVRRLVFQVSTVWLVACQCAVWVAGFLGILGAIMSVLGYVRIVVGFQISASG